MFRQQEGCSLETYILREKIRQAKELLQYSDDKIQEIAEYLSFSSQSSFRLELISTKEAVDFYKKHGFEERPCEWDGPGMFKMI